MKPILAASLLAIAPTLAIAAPAAAQSSAPGGFRLPTPSPTPTANPDIQGPVDPDQPILTRPRAPTPTPRPAATASPAPTPTATVARAPAPRSAATPARTAPTIRDPAPARPRPGDLPSPEPAAQATAAPLPLPTVAAPASTASEAPVEEDGGFPWAWTLLGLVGLAAGAAGFAFLRKRREEHADTPVIEPPLARRAAPPALPAAKDGAPLAPVVPLMIEAQALKLSRSIMFATLSYELRLANRGPTPLGDIRLGGDLVTAHSRVPVDQQLADPAQPLEVIQRVASLAPGESVVLAGDLKLPVQHIRPIPQGKAILYVPLLRLRIEAEGLMPFARTFVVGRRPAAPGGKLQPFRLDETPQTYRSIAQRALD